MGVVGVVFEVEDMIVFLGTLGGSSNLVRVLSLGGCPPFFCFPLNDCPLLQQLLF